jgi:hypothetical protein
MMAGVTGDVVAFLLASRLLKLGIRVAKRTILAGFPMIIEWPHEDADRRNSQDRRIAARFGKICRFGVPEALIGT